ncbi:MAG: flagellar biosynthetic protein FliP [Phycisphaerae bacterium]|nr:flagellar biosynthetic protein FliP [Phycisphaerae bacterium]
MIGDAARLLPASPADAATYGGIVPGGPDGPVPPAGVGTENRDGFSVALNIMVLLTVLALAPSIMLMTTCFVRILIVLALLRQAIGTQTVPPAQVITGLALFMTAMVMAPTMERVWDEAVEPWQAGEIAGYDELWDRARQPIRDYMFDQIEATGNWSTVYTFLNYRGVDTSEPSALTRADVDLTVLVPAYMLSELKVGFLMGFRVYLPFLVIDMVIASVLISMSMMMLPPVLISLPFKLLLFVLVDGWSLVVGSLLESFVTEGMSARMSAEEAAIGLLLLPLVGARVIWRSRPRDRLEAPREL